MVTLEVVTQSGSGSFSPKNSIGGFEMVQFCRTTVGTSIFLPLKLGPQYPPESMESQIRKCQSNAGAILGGMLQGCTPPASAAFLRPRAAPTGCPPLREAAGGPAKRAWPLRPSTLQPLLRTASGWPQRVGLAALASGFAASSQIN